MPSAEHQQSSCEKLELKADERILKRIIKLRDDYAKKHEEIANKRSARILSLVSEYKTEEEVQEAYGWDLITETEKDEICAIFRGAAAESQMETEYSIMISWLNSWIRTVKSAIEELRYQQMTPKQKAEHERAVEDWNNKIDMLRRKQQ